MQRLAGLLLSLSLSVALAGCGGDGSSRSANRGPTAVISPSGTDGFAPFTIQFTGAASSDSDGQISRYQWDFDDGTAVATTTTASQVEHTFTEPGGYNVRLTVTDDSGAMATTLLFVRVRGTTLSGTVRILSTSAVDTDLNDRRTSTVQNNDFVSAQPIASPLSLGGFVNLPGTGQLDGNLFSSGDPADFFAITLAGNELILLTIADPTADLDLRLWSSDQMLIDASLGTQVTESLNVPGPGDYFIEVLPANRLSNISGASNYVLTVGQDLNIAARQPGRLSDTFVAGELLLATQSGANSTALHNTYDLTGHGRAGRFQRTRLGQRTGAAIADRFGGVTRRLPDSTRMTRQQRLKYQTLLALKELRRDTRISALEPNLLLQPHLTPDDAYYPMQWHLREINLPAAWDLTTGSPTGPNDVIVAVVDTGILAQHPDLSGQLVAGYDFITDPSRARDGDGIDPDPADEGDFAFGASSSFHGTHVAGTVAARADNAEGVAGVSWGAKLMPLRALGVDGGTTFDVIQAIRFAAGLANDSGTMPAQRADIINLSLGSPFFSASAQATIDTVRASGVILIASAGNESTSVPSYPAAYNGVLSVSATTIDGSLAPYSNFGAIDLAAPGGYNATDINGDGFGDGVVSTLGDDSHPGGPVLGYGALNGTSMAAPHVAGVAALMKAIHPGLTAAEFEAALAAGELTDDRGAPGFDQSFGFGQINAQKAVLAAFALAGGSGIDPGPVLGSSLSAIDLGVLASTQTISLRNLGSGTIQIDQINSSEAWLNASPMAVDADGLGDYQLQVDRSGLGEGSFSATLQFVPLDPATHPAIVTVTVQVAGTNPAADAGLFYIIAVNEAGATVGNVAIVAVDNAEYRFTLNDIPAGRYQIFGGSDMDDDDYLCDAGEACGAYRTLDTLERLIVDPAVTPELTEVDFIAEFRAVITNQSAAGQSAATPATAEAAADGFHFVKPDSPDTPGPAQR